MTILQIIVIIFSKELIKLKEEDKEKVLKMKQTLEDFSQLTRELPSLLTVCNEEYNHCQNIMTDINHYLELHTFNASQGYLLSKKISETRKQRREAKDLILMLEPIIELFKKNKAFFDQMDTLRGELRKIVKYTTDGTRSYNPKVLHELFGKEKLALSTMELAFKEKK